MSSSSSSGNNPNNDNTNTNKDEPPHKRPKTEARMSEEDDADDEPNEYVRDGFVVDDDDNNYKEQEQDDDDDDLVDSDVDEKQDEESSARRRFTKFELQLLPEDLDLGSEVARSPAYRQYDGYDSDSLQDFIVEADDPGLVDFPLQEDDDDSLLEEGEQQQREESIAATEQAQKEHIRRYFEPVQLVEQLCTARDEDIRQADLPERLYDLRHQLANANPVQDLEAAPTEPELEHATWLVHHVPDLAQVHDVATVQEKEEILTSIAMAFRLMQQPRYLEPAFVQLYRQDYVTHAVVRNHLNSLLDADKEWQRFQTAKTHVATELVMHAQVPAQEDDTQGPWSAGAWLEHQIAKRATQIKVRQIEKQIMAEAEAETTEKKGEREEQLQTLIAELKRLETENIEPPTVFLQELTPYQKVCAKIQQNALWDLQAYQSYLNAVEEPRHALDVHNYAKLVQEGIEAVCKQDLPTYSVPDEANKRRNRSRRFDRNFYRTCVTEGLRVVCYQFLPPPVVVGTIIEAMETGATPARRGVVGRTPKMPPQEFASAVFGTDGFDAIVPVSAVADSDDPLKHCRHVAALELSAEPRVRKYLRQAYRKNVLLTTKPTKKGMQEIDAFHTYYGAHLIRNKPVRKHFLLDVENPALVDEGNKKLMDESCLLFLKILNAEREGYITIHLHLSLLGDPSPDWYTKETPTLMANDNQELMKLGEPLRKACFQGNTNVDDWMVERAKTIAFAIERFMIPKFERELRRDLQEAAFKKGVKEASVNLRAMAMEGPYRPPYLNRSSSPFIVPSGGLKLAGVSCATSKEEATCLAFVSEHGEAVDQLVIPFDTNLSSNRLRNKVKSFLLKHQPSAILVGTSGGYRSQVCLRKLAVILNYALSRQTKLRSNGGRWECSIELVDDSVSQLYGRSVRSKKEFPQLSVNHKVAISIARHNQNPLAELTYAWNTASDAGVFGTELLFLDVHPLQQYLPRSFLLKEYERVLVDALASVGVEWNVAHKFDHLGGSLLFVPGLGPRKAAKMKTALPHVLAARNELVDKKYMGPTVYRNAAPFIRITKTPKSNPLDETRLHPEVYKWVGTIARAALDLQGGHDNSVVCKLMESSREDLFRLFKETLLEWENGGGSSDTFDYLAWDPRVAIPGDRWSDAISDVDVQGVADNIQKKGEGRWLSHLEMLTWELRLPFADPRVPKKQLSADKLFTLITGETDRSLRPGNLVTGRVVSTVEFGANVRLEGNISAFIPLRLLSDDKIKIADEVVRPGQVIDTVVQEVKKEHLSVDLTLKSAAFLRIPSSWPRPASLSPIDSCFDSIADETMEKSNAPLRETRAAAARSSLRPSLPVPTRPVQRVASVTRRACTHPAFRNKKHDECEAELLNGGSVMVGQVLLRPSSSKNNALALHWLVREGTTKRIEVMEEDKGNPASIGKRLKVKDVEFGSIDELIARYISPMNDFVRELVEHRKFSDVPEDQLDQQLLADKAKNASSIPYGICWMENLAGYASIRFAPSSSSTTTSHYPIGINPNGFTLKGVCYPKLDQALNAFKLKFGSNPAA